MKKEPRARYRIRWQRVFLLIMLFFVTVTAFTGAMLYLYTDSFFTAKHTKSTTATSALTTDDGLKKRINILLLGVDEPDREVPGSTARRSDTLIVASISPQDGTASLLSIPRDTHVSIPGRKGMEKISHAYAYGGADLAKQTVEALLGIPINYYTAIDWQGFIKVVDILGGVNLYVEHNMKYQDPYANLTIELTRGYQHLDGKKAGEYVRFRHDELGDIGRVQRQQRFMKAVSEEMLQVGTLLKVPSILSTINQYVATDMSLFTMVRLANTLKDIQPNKFKTEMLPGDFADIDGLSYWMPNQKETRRLVQQLFTEQAAVTVGHSVSVPHIL